MRVYSKYERVRTKTKKKKALYINFKKYFLLVVLFVVVLFTLDFTVKKINFFKVKKVKINNLSYIKPEILYNIYSSCFDKFANKVLISQLVSRLDSMGLFKEVRVSRTLFFDLSINLREYDLLGIVNCNGRSYYLNENGILLSDSLLDTVFILPEFRDLIIDSMRVLNKYNITLSKKYIKYIRDNFGNIYSKIKFIRFNRGNEIVFVFENGKLLELSKYTNLETIKQLGFIFDYLYLENSFNLIDLKYNNQIITKKI